MERSFKKEVQALTLGAGETFRGEGILAVTKALLQSGVSYVGGYQGAPVSHLLDVMVQAKEYLDELGVHVEACTSEASAAAMLGASINYPARGAVTWKSIVGTNVGACHGPGSVTDKESQAPAVSTRHKLDGPPKEFIYDRLAHPPAIFRQEKLKCDVRLPAARKFIVEHQLNEVFPGAESSLGIIVQGGLYNGLLLALKTLGLADAFGASRVPMLALNVVYPLVPEEIVQFCSGKKSVLVLEEGQPEFIEQEIATHLRRRDVPAKLHGKDCMHMAGDYNVEALVRGLAKFLAEHAPHLDLSSAQKWLDAVGGTKQKAAALLGPLP